MSDYVGKTTEFLINGQWTVFEVIHQSGAILKVRSLDLHHVARMSIGRWDKQVEAIGHLKKGTLLNIEVVEK